MVKIDLSLEKCPEGVCKAKKSRVRWSGEGAGKT